MGEPFGKRAGRPGTAGAAVRPGRCAAVRVGRAARCRGGRAVGWWGVASGEPGQHGQAQHIAEDEAAAETEHRCRQPARQRQPQQTEPHQAVLARAAVQQARQQQAEPRRAEGETPGRALGEGLLENFVDEGLGRWRRPARQRRHGQPGGEDGAGSIGPRATAAGPQGQQQRAHTQKPGLRLDQQRQLPHPQAREAQGALSRRFAMRRGGDRGGQDPQRRHEQPGRLHAHRADRQPPGRRRREGRAEQQGAEAEGRPGTPGQVLLQTLARQQGEAGGRQRQ